MVAYLEKTDGNAEFHEIIDFLTRSSIHYALTVSPVVSTMFVEQFWMTAKSKTINNVRYITATVVGKPVPVLEASIRIRHPVDRIPIRDEDDLSLPKCIKKLKKKARPVINHHKAWIKSLSIKKRLARKKKMEYVSKQGRKTFKSILTVHKDPAFDDLDDAIDYMKTEDAHDEGTVKDSEGTRVSTKDQVSTDKLKVSTDKLNEGTAEPKDGNSDESAAPTTVFRDDETIAQFLAILTLKPLPKIDPKDKGKKVLEEKAESDAESEGVNEAEKKFKMLANDEEIARKVQEEWEAEEGEEELLRKKLLKPHSPMSMTLSKQDLMQTRFLLRSFKKKIEKSSLLSKEPSFFMIPLLHKEDFLLNKYLRLSEISFIQEIS
ncbi:hypothetical protein Tco_1238787 [Tanacetum coccineum]